MTSCIGGTAKKACRIYALCKSILPDVRAFFSLLALAFWYTIKAVRILFASTNHNKAAEIKSFLKCPVDLVTDVVSGYIAPDEDGVTFAQNAYIKARCVAGIVLDRELSDYRYVLSDDSGICAPCLGEAPGIHTARFMKQHSPNGFQTLWNMLQEHNDARVYMFGSFVLTDIREKSIQSIHIFNGRVDGHMIWPPVGDFGFGFDGIFVPNGFASTFAQMSSDQKTALSHRGQCLRSLQAFLT